MTKDQKAIRQWIDNLPGGQDTLVVILGQEYKINKRFRGVVDGMNKTANAIRAKQETKP